MQLVRCCDKLLAQTKYCKGPVSKKTRRSVPCLSSPRSSAWPYIWSIRAKTPLSKTRVGSSLVPRASGTSGAEEIAEELPSTFDLELAVLLAGFAFESYNQPKGGLRDSDAKDTNTAFMSPFVQEQFAGVLEVNLKSAAGLRKADIIGQSDPYAVLKVGSSAWRSSVKLFTLDPVWNETCRLYVRDIHSQLRIQLYDQDLIGSDDDLGVAFISVKDLHSSEGPVEVELPVQDLGASSGAGGTVSIEAQFFPFSKRSSPGEEAEAEPVLSLKGLGRALIGAITERVEALAAEKRRKQWEADLWVLNPEGDWSALASLKTLHEVPLPSEFEKVAYVENTRTDTQVCVWRSPGRRVMVLAFRGTETTKWKDIATDANFLPAGFNAERVSDSEDGPQVHSGFLEAFDSVRAQLMSLVDTILGSNDGPWQVYVTGHSLGGALATLMSYELASSAAQKRRDINVVMYNYGSPRVGNIHFANKYNELVPDSHRLVNGIDGVPRVPLLLDYCHVEHGVYIDKDGSISMKSPTANTLEDEDVYVDYVAKVVGERAAKDALDVVATLQGGDAVSAHMEDCYYDTLKLCAAKRLNQA